MATENSRQFTIPADELLTARLVIDIPDRYFVKVRGAEVPVVEVSSRVDTAERMLISDHAFISMGDTTNCVALTEGRDEQGAIYRISLDPDAPASHVVAKQPGRNAGVIDVHIQAPSFLRTEINLSNVKHEPDLYTSAGVIVTEMQNTAVITHPLAPRQQREVRFGERSSGSVTVIDAGGRAVGAFSFENVDLGQYSAMHLPQAGYTLHSIFGDFSEAYATPDIRWECSHGGQVNILDDVPDLSQEPSSARSALDSIESLVDKTRGRQPIEFDYGSLDF